MVLPIGLPDKHDRAVLIKHFLNRHQVGTVDSDPIVERAEGLTPADLEAICQRAAHRAFQREVQTDLDSQVGTADLLLIADEHRPSLGVDELKIFEEDVARFERV